MNTKQKLALAKAAKEAGRNAYHPVTSTGTGAALMTKEGSIYTGCNVQSVISGLGCCAERCAIYNAVAHSAYNYKAIAVYFPTKNGAKPCGACLQLISEFAQVAKTDIRILMVNKEGRITAESTANKMLPAAYGPRTAGKKLSAYEKNKDNLYK
ncbi:cytidine deaminase [Candidatus Woesearchaeota archaeon]|nr:cytidine deaminase [Candidatus Woesearchaeota archaeon]